MTIRDILLALVGTLNIIVTFLIALSVATFVWGVAKRINASGDPRKVRDSYYYLIIGVVAFAVITSVWAIVSFLAGLFGYDTVTIPQFIDVMPTDTQQTSG